MDKLSGSAIIPESVPPKFFSQHLKPYHFISKFILNKSLLEIGCGDGYGAAYLSPYAKEIIAVDCSAQTIEHARNRYPRSNLIFKVGNGKSLDFESCRFDAVCLFQVIEHIPVAELHGFLSEVKRVLKDGGKLFLSTLNIEYNQKPGKTYKKNPDHHKEFKLNELRDCLSEVFPGVRIYGLHLAFKHRFYQRLKRIGLFNFLPDKINPVVKFYNHITIDDFVVTRLGLRKAIDFICCCKK